MFRKSSGASCRENADSHPRRCLKIESKNKRRRRPGLEPGPITTNVDCCARLGRNLPTTHLVVMDPGVRRDDRSFHTPNVFAYRALMSSLCACTWAGSAFNNFKLDSGTCPPFSFTCAWKDR